jgi:WXG100 family type VII secretion target
MAGNGNAMQLGERTLLDIATEVQTGRDKFKAAAKKLEGQILDKTAAWQGAGGASFFNLHAQWNQKQNKIIDALNEFEASLNIADKDAKNTDSDQSSAHQTNLAALDGISANY